MPLEMPSSHGEHDAQAFAQGDREPKDTSKLPGVPTAKDRLVVAIVSLMMLIFLAGLTFGATHAFHTGSIGWVVLLAVICFAVVTLNVVLFLSGNHL